MLIEVKPDWFIESQEIVEIFSCYESPGVQSCLGIIYGHARTRIEIKTQKTAKEFAEYINEVNSGIKI